MLEIVLFVVIPLTNARPVIVNSVAMPFIGRIAADGKVININVIFAKKKHNAEPIESTPKGYGLLRVAGDLDAVTYTGIF